MYIVLHDIDTSTGSPADKTQTVAHGGSDEDGKEQGGDSHGAAQEPAHCQHDNLDGQADRSDGNPRPLVQARHESITWTRTEVGREIQPAAKTHEGNADEGLGEAPAD